MLLKIRGYELEIVQGKFVCLGQNNGEISHFGEWKYLEPQLQEKFEAVREELLEVMKDFINSKEMAVFEAISEEYKKDQLDCGSKKPEKGTFGVSRSVGIFEVPPLIGLQKT